MQSRRNFISKVASGLAGTLAALQRPGRQRPHPPRHHRRRRPRHRRSCAKPSPAPTPNASASPTSTPAAWKTSRAIAPDAKTYLDYRHLLEDPSIDAVLIATPQHLHAEHFVAALDAGKHVYQEKTMAFTVDHAKRMRAAYERAGAQRTVQIGHQWTLLRPSGRRRRFLQAGTDGQDHLHPGPHVPQHAARQAPVGASRLSRHDAREHPLESLPGRAPRRAISTPTATSTGAIFWDYSGGNVYENMCHQLAFWYKVMGLKIPAPPP